MKVDARIYYKLIPNNYQYWVYFDSIQLILVNSLHNFPLYICYSTKKEKLFDDGL